jgi:hypothetical protein
MGKLDRLNRELSTQFDEIKRTNNRIDGLARQQESLGKGLREVRSILCGQDTFEPWAKGKWLKCVDGSIKGITKDSLYQSNGLSLSWPGRVWIKRDDAGASSSHNKLCFVPCDPPDVWDKATHAKFTNGRGSIYLIVGQSKSEICLGKCVVGCADEHEHWIPLRRLTPLLRVEVPQEPEWDECSEKEATHVKPDNGFITSFTYPCSGTYKVCGYLEKEAITYWRKVSRPPRVEYREVKLEDCTRAKVGAADRSYAYR